MTTTPELVAAIAAAERELADRFAAYGLPDPDEKAAALMRWLKVTGWRLNRELDLRPASPPARVAPPAVALAHLADARVAVEQVRRERQTVERETNTNEGEAR